MGSYEAARKTSKKVINFFVVGLTYGWQKLWKRFFDAVTIEQRRNERCQMTHAPKRYWKDMCEMALRGRGTAGKAEQNAEAAR